MHWEKPLPGSEGDSGSTGPLTPLMWPGGSRVYPTTPEHRRTQLILSSAAKGTEKLAKERITTINPTGNFNYGCPDLTPIIYCSWIASINRQLIITNSILINPISWFQLITCLCFNVLLKSLYITSHTKHLCLDLFIGDKFCNVQFKYRIKPNCIYSRVCLILYKLVWTYYETGFLRTIRLHNII